MDIVSIKGPNSDTENYLSLSVTS